VYETLAELEFQHLAQPFLRHVQDEQHRRDHEEHAELDEEVVEVAARQSVEERLVPAVEANLAVGREDDDQKNRGDEQNERLADSGGGDGAGHQAHLLYETRMDGFFPLCRGARYFF
jgi:hypothetical protein